MRVGIALAALQLMIITSTAFGYGETQFSESLVTYNPSVLLSSFFSFHTENKNFLIHAVDSD